MITDYVTIYCELSFTSSCNTTTIILSSYLISIVRVGEHCPLSKKEISIEFLLSSMNLRLSGAINIFIVILEIRSIVNVSSSTVCEI